MPEYMMRDLYKAKKYEEAVSYASDETVRANFSEWDYLFLAKSLKALECYKEYLDLYKEFHKRFQESDLLDDDMGWCLYYLYIRNFDFETGNRNKYLQQIDYVLSHCTDSQYSPKNRVATVAVDAVFKRKLAVNPDYDLGNKYLSFIDPLSLEDVGIVRMIDDRMVKIPTEREQWYTRKVKALTELKQYEECLHVIDEAFENVDKFHNNGNHWLNYRRALCYMGLGDYDSAEKTINSILQRFEHWCFYALLFEINEARGNNEEALRYGAICSLFDREHKLRVTFYEEFAEFLTCYGYPREAALHYKLIELIREEEGWKAIHLPEEFAYPEDVEEMDKKAVIRELLPFWREEKDRGIEFHEGVISKILPNGKSGFIHEDPNNNYYFNARDFTSKVYDLCEGERVKFALAERFDKSKNEMKLNAVQISFIR